MKRSTRTKGMATPGNLGAVITPASAPSIDLGSFGVRFLLAGRDTGEAFSLVEHLVPPHTLAAPLHRHTREDEYSVVLAGRLTLQLGDGVYVARPGDVVLKPRGQWHTFWNAAEEACRFLELITPAGFERFFAELGADPEAMAGEGAAALDAAYGLDVDYDSIARLTAAHGIDFPD